MSRTGKVARGLAVLGPFAAWQHKSTWQHARAHRNLVSQWSAAFRLIRQAGRQPLLLQVCGTLQLQVATSLTWAHHRVRLASMDNRLAFLSPLQHVGTAPPPIPPATAPPTEGTAAGYIQCLRRPGGGGRGAGAGLTARPGDGQRAPEAPHPPLGRSRWA